jgi:Kef-type K+ transport system membrane component KefB
MTFALLVADPFSRTLLLLAFTWLVAKLAGEAATRLRLPAVAGELAVGVAITAAAKSFPWVPNLAASPEAEVLANLGVIVLMFMVGLESTVPQMLKVGMASLRVAVIGVVAPMAMGLLGAWFLLPKGTPLAVDLFLGACLCATSIGISAQVLREQGAQDSTEGRIIVGAAVIDDVLGLLVLTLVSGIVATSGSGALPWAALAKTLGLALTFLGLALTLGRFVTPHLFRLANRLRSEQLLLPLGLAFAFLLAHLGNLAGLATIVGAYAAGLILEPAHIEALEQREQHSLEELVHPLVAVLSPLFFVLMGARVDASALFQPATLLFATALALLGLVGKWVSSLGAGRGLRSAVVGWGMVPRGEVGLIFVAAGSQLRLGDQPLLSAELQAGIVGALLLTTVAGPIGLGWVLRGSTRA